MAHFPFRTSLFALAGMATVASTLTLVSRPGFAQVDVTLPAFVKLQAATPGIAQTGHSNITGTAIAGQHVGGGSGLTGVNADLLDGINSTAFLQSVPNPLNLSGNVAINAVIKGTNTINLGGSSGVTGEATGTTTAVSGVIGITASTIGRGVAGFANSTTGASSAGYFDNNSTSGYGVRSISKGLYGVYGEVTTPDMANFGVFGRSSSIGGVGVKGENMSILSRGVVGISGYIGVEASGGAYGVTGYGSDAGVYGEGGGTGPGVWGLNQSGTSAEAGVFGESFSTSGRAVIGIASASSGTTYGGRFETDSSDGRGVYGLATSIGATDTPYGIRGQASTSTNGFGVYAVGDSGASGVKSFRIDHPADPENRYLLHYSSESPFPQNFYNGNVTTDANGYAWVELPDYFQSINVNFKYQLTVVSSGQDFVQAMVSKKIIGNRFQIRTSAPQTEVSWEVKADRNDLRVQSKRPADVVFKSGAEKGTLQHPEYYGLPVERGVDYAVRSHAKKPERGSKK